MTGSTGSYSFNLGILKEGVTYTASSDIGGTTLSASVTLGGSSVIVLEPINPTLPTPQFPLGVLTGVLVTLFALIAFFVVFKTKTRQKTDEMSILRVPRALARIVKNYYKEEI